MNNKFDDGLSVLISNLARIHSNIRYADAKSGVILLINIGLLKATYEILGTGDIFEEMTSYLFVLPSVILLMISSVICIFVIKPRGEEYSKGRGIGLIDPVRVAQYNNSEDYIVAISNADPENTFEHAYELMWDLSNIDRSKYRTLSYALYFSMFSWLVFLILILEIAYKSQG